jgi:hypothetical protein
MKRIIDKDNLSLSRYFLIKITHLIRFNDTVKKFFELLIFFTLKKSRMTHSGTRDN